MSDDVQEAPYCVACRRSSAGKWRKHVFSRGHQHAAQQFLLRQAARLQALCDAATAADRWRCVFCDVAPPAAAAPSHFAAAQHRQRVESFCRHHRCDVDRQTRPRLWLQAAKRRELEAALAEREQGEQEQPHAEQQEPTTDQAAAERVEEFLTSATTRLQEVQTDRRRAADSATEAVETTREQQEALLGPQLALATGARHRKTVTSADGVLQNPLGRHEGKRVWGGGIVKMKRAEWIPWAVDQLVKEEQADHPEAHHGADSTAFVHRVTDLARGEGLTSIAKVSWSASVGNVHTAAVPPWMVQSEEEYKRCNRREQAAPPPSLPTRPNDKAEGSDKKRRDIFSELQSKTEYGPNWLPNFGGVWQEGPRSKTKQAFRKTVNLAQASRDQPIATTTISQVPERAALQRVPPPKSIQASPPPPQRLENHRPGPAERTTQLECEIPAPSVSKSSSIEASEDKSKTANSLDAKKQLLLAQKERLRAKMAARRRQ